ncbi:hypothetical protein RHECNPAF_44600101 [Rhizobium etli CNPAF512]|nr:hypothetical protein RHECNPAF_44600101 [Rhizobium etli CNPAF512]
MMLKPAPTADRARYPSPFRIQFLPMCRHAPHVFRFAPEVREACEAVTCSNSG